CTTLPRCHASRTASTTGPDTPSTVVITLPTAVSAGVWHDFVLRPSISTVHAAQNPIPQPYLVPVNPSTSRNTHNSGLAAKRSSTSTSAPFTFSFTTISWARGREDVPRWSAPETGDPSGGHARVDPLLQRVHLLGGPRAVARHLPAAHRPHDGVGLLD